MINIRTYKPEDFEAILALLQDNLLYDQISREVLHEKIYNDPFPETAGIYVADVNHKPVAFMMGVLRKIRGDQFGYIKLMAVDSQYRRKGIAFRLYQHLETFLRNAGCNFLRIMDVPMNYFMPGIDPRYTAAVCFAEKSGFTRFAESCNMTVDLKISEWDTADEENQLRNDNIDIRRAKKEDREEILNFLKSEWELWQYEVTMAMKTAPGCVFIARQNGKVKAFAAYNGNNIGTGWFGPMGTHPDMRGKGIGRILLYRCLKDMKDAGLAESTIPWVAPVCFYAHYAHAQVTRTFWRYQKILTNE